jgi:AcrR family transcriptional regulator
MSISGRISNAERTRVTREALVAAARSSFAEIGYEATSTPAVAKAAGLTRGALYHHFADKRALFHAVVESEGRAIGAAVEGATAHLSDPREALITGSVAYLEAMSVPGRSRLLLVDGPAVLGADETEQLDGSADSLRDGLRAVPGIRDPDTVATLLAAAFDRAALEIARGADADTIRAAMLWLVERATDQGSAR